MKIFSLNFSVRSKSAYLLIAFYLLVTTELSQLLKLPILAGHFLEHKAATKKLTIYQFLYIHYGQNDVKYPDYEEDMKLPFKESSNFLLQTNVIAPPQIFRVTLSKNLSKVLHKKKYFTNDSLLTSSFPSNIWQPPKKAS